MGEWAWSTVRPGLTNSPAQSITSAPPASSPSPRAAMTPSWISRSSLEEMFPSSSIRLQFFSKTRPILNIPPSMMRVFF